MFYEYVHDRIEYTSDIQKALNQRAKDGWRLVGTFCHDRNAPGMKSHSFHFIFEKQKSKTPLEEPPEALPVSDEQINPDPHW